MSENSKKIIKEIIEKNYSKYPSLNNIKEKIKELYIQKYEYISKNNKYFNVYEEKDIIELTFVKMKKAFDKIMPEFRDLKQK